MSYHLVQLTDFSNLERFANSIETALTKANRFDEEEAEYLNVFREESAAWLAAKEHEKLVIALFELRKRLRLDQKCKNDQ